MANTTELKILITAENDATKDIEKVRKDINGIGSDSEKMAKSVDKSTKSAGQSFDGLKRLGGLAATAIAGLAVKIGVDAVQSAAQFSKEMANVSTLVDTSVESMSDMKTQILELSKRMPVAMSDLTSSLYDIRSAGISASMAMGVLEQSGILATAGLGTTKEATDLMTSAMNSFKSEGLTAAQTADILFKTVKAGKTTVSELAMSFGASAPVIAEAGVGLRDFQAATAALTTTGLPASQAQMGLRQAIVALIKPTTDMSAIFKKLGVEDGRELIATSDNMGEAFKRVKDAADKGNISYEKAIGSVEALNATTGIMTTTSDAYKDTLGNMKNGQNEVNKAFEKQNEEASAQYQILKNELNVEMIKLGNKILPVLIENMRALPFLPEVWKEWKQNIEKVIGAIESLFNPIKQVTNTIDAWKKLGSAIADVWSKISKFGSGEWAKVKKLFSATGGIVPQHLADGGIVYASGGFYEPKGTDTIPAMLTPGEMVLNAGQQSALFNQLNTGKGRSVTINITGNNYFSGEADEDRLINKIKLALSREQERANWGIS